MGKLIDFLKEMQELQAAAYSGATGTETNQPTPINLFLNIRKPVKLISRNRYLQIAFNGTLADVHSILPKIPYSEKILIEAGTPFIKREGIKGIREIARIWGGYVVADLKTMDGGREEVSFAKSAGASAATVLGSAPIETLNNFILQCENYGIDSMIDMIGVEEPHKILRHLKKPPKVVVLHKGRDEETIRGKVIGYKNVNKIRAKYNCIISAAGGVDLKEARSAIFNGANIVVANIVEDGSEYTGISTNQDITVIAKKFLETVE